MSENLHLEFVDEALMLVREAEAAGICLRILGSIAYRLQCPKNLHLFDDMARVLTDVDFAGMKLHNRAIRDFMVARGYQPDEGVYVASEGARHLYLHPDTALALGLIEDDAVTIKGEAGEISARLSLDPAVHKNTAFMHQGWWHESGSVNVLVPSRLSDMGNQAAYYDSFCTLEKIY